MKIEGHQIDCIVLGASLGGVEAINKILRGLTAPLAAPLLITIHIPPHSEFIDAAYALHDSAIRIKEAEDKEPLEAGTVYFAPSDYHLLIEKSGVLSLSSEEPVCYARPSINVMFESAALALGPKVLAILLTGANNDGAAGMQAISHGKGMTWIQEPGDAFYPAMPQAALDLINPTRTVTIQEIVTLLTESQA